MKWLIAFIGILCIAGGAVFFVKIQNEKASNVLPATVVETTPTPTPALKQSIVIDVQGVPTRTSWTIVNPQQIELYSNLKDQHLSEQIKVDKSCQILVNGGFYSKENTHLGLFITDFKTVSVPIQNALLNGFLSIDSADKVLISADSPDNNPRIALQSGPLLLQNNKALTLAINNDEPSRRIVAGITKNNQLIFLAFYKDSAEFEGPFLGSLPEIIKLFEKKTNIEIVDAINLDGGSASIFITNYVLLRELAHVGSYFCVK